MPNNGNNGNNGKTAEQKIKDLLKKAAELAAQNDVPSRVMRVNLERAYQIEKEKFNAKNQA